jgi:ribosome-associated translation inhibitor RaiA
MDTREGLGDVVVHVHGRVSSVEHLYAHDKIAHLSRSAPGSVLTARVDLISYAGPARDRPALAKGELNVNGRMVRAHADAETMPAAVDALQARLRDRLERLADLERAKHLRHRDADGAWHHGDAGVPRPSYYPRPVEDREIVRRKIFALDALTPEEAVVDLEQLDHDFYLFRNAETGNDNVIQRVADGCYELLEPANGGDRERSGSIRPSPLRPSTMSVEAAMDLLDLGDLPFVFFLDPTTARGAVVYRRYDGHYGLVVATDEVAASEAGG